MSEKHLTTLIVGASSSFGLAISQVLSQNGHKLILTCHSKTGRRKLVEFNSEDDIKIINLDITSPEQIKSFVDSLPQINNIIYSVSAPIEFKNAVAEDWRGFERHWQAQVQGLWFLISALTKSQIELSRVIAIGSSVLFNAPPARLASYTVAKYALLGLIKSLAVNLAPQGVTVNMVSPGLSQTGLSEKYPEKLIELTKMQTPLKRLVKTEDVGSIVEFLLSDRASYLTGLNIPVDGGLTMI